MTRHSSSCWPPRSEKPEAPRGARLPAVATAVGLTTLIVAGASPAAAACAACGAVRGTVTVEQAAVRADGAKHDLDVVISLESVGGPEPRPASGAVDMDQRGLVFIPHVLAIQRGTTVRFLNSDPDEHNVYFLDDRTGETLDIGTWPQGVSVDHTFSEEGIVITLCKLHLEMAAYIVVVGDPWFVQATIDPADERADYVIEEVPPGVYEARVWHKKLKQKGGPVRITVGPGETVELDAVITKARYAKAAG